MQEDICPITQISIPRQSRNVIKPSWGFSDYNNTSSLTGAGFIHIVILPFSLVHSVCITPVICAHRTAKFQLYTCFL